MAQQQATKSEIEGVMQLFGLCHDLLAQAQFPGHVSDKVQQALKFLAWQFQDFKARAEVLGKAETPAAEPVATPVATEAPKA